MKKTLLEDAEQAKKKNIIDMAFAFSAMTRVFEKESTDKIVKKLDLTFSQIASLQNENDFKNVHNDFCRWFEQNIHTAERQKSGRIIKKSDSASYGQGAKVLDVALKVYVYYCNSPAKEKNRRLVSWLNAAVDTRMMRHLKNNVLDKEAMSISATAIEDVDKRTYTILQKLVRKDIKRSYSGKIYPVQWDDIVFRKLNNKDNKNRVYPPAASTNSHSSNPHLITWPVTLDGMLGMGQGGVNQREFQITKLNKIKACLPADNPNNPYCITASNIKGRKNPGRTVKCWYNNNNVDGQYHRSVKVGIWIGADFSHGRKAASHAWKNFIKHFGITVGMSTARIPVYIDFYLDRIVIRKAVCG